MGDRYVFVFGFGRDRRSGLTGDELVSSLGGWAASKKLRLLIVDSNV